MDLNNRSKRIIQFAYLKYDRGYLIYMLSEETKMNVGEKLGLQFEEIVNSDVNVLTKLLQKKSKKMDFLKTIGSRLLESGSVFVYLNRLVDLDKINRKLNKI